MNLSELGQIIAQNRKKLKITQLELAQNTGISRVTLSQIENASVNEIGINKIILLCELLGLEIIAKPKNIRPTLQDLIKERNNHD
ncbi:MAG: helix-turn-helix transcriptional regulator [Burkholderiales bacterium]|nr:helix-turn-helix transcriptional regulator [Burkholderiales bacterium]